ncbi:MAG: flagellar motor switch protein FliN [Candidatus Tyrphobacter sp.]
MTEAERASLDHLRSVPLELVALLGSRRMTLRELLALGEGSVVKLDRAAGEPIDLLVGAEVVARGEIVAIDDRFGVRITSVTGSQEHE